MSRSRARLGELPISTAFRPLACLHRRISGIRDVRALKSPVVRTFRSHTWDFLRIEKVVWSVLPSQALTLLAMISVVALSSSLDIAAIEIELKRPLDYNHELKTVGWSNVISGLMGGYTGSYSEYISRSLPPSTTTSPNLIGVTVFSQTIFS